MLVAPCLNQLSHRVPPTTVVQITDSSSGSTAGILEYFVWVHNLNIFLLVASVNTIKYSISKVTAGSIPDGVIGIFH